MLLRSGASTVALSGRLCWGIAALAILSSCTRDPGRLLSAEVVRPIVVRDTGVEPLSSTMDQDRTFWGWLLSLLIPAHGDSYDLILQPGAKPEQILQQLEQDLGAELTRGGGRKTGDRHVKGLCQIDYLRGRLRGQWNVSYARQTNGKVALFLSVIEYASRK